LQEAKKEIEHLFYAKRRDIIVLEAAVLIQAKWQNECTEIWTCIIPQNEVNFFIIDELYFAMYVCIIAIGIYFLLYFLFSILYLDMYEVFIIVDIT